MNVANTGLQGPPGIQGPPGPTGPGIRLGGLEFDHKVSVTSILAIIMAFVGVVGGWYTFDARVKRSEDSIQYLEQARREDSEARQKVQEALEDLNITVGKLEQRLEDEDNRKKGAR